MQEKYNNENDITGLWEGTTKAGQLKLTGTITREKLLNLLKKCELLQNGEEGVRVIAFSNKYAEENPKAPKYNLKVSVNLQKNNDDLPF